MDRETRVIETPVQKKKVTIYTYITGRELEYIQEPLLQAMNVRNASKDVEINGLDISKVRESTHRLIEKHVVSVDGNKDNVVDQILDMHQQDYQFVVDDLNGAVKKN